MFRFLNLFKMKKNNHKKVELKKTHGEISRLISDTALINEYKFIIAFPFLCEEIEGFGYEDISVKLRCIKFDCRDSVDALVYDDPQKLSDDVHMLNSMSLHSYPVSFHFINEPIVEWERFIENLFQDSSPPELVHHNTKYTSKYGELYVT